MASLNVAEWTPDQVAEWLSGLGPTVELYVGALRARGLAGARLLTLRCDDLEALGVHIIGHQELVLEAVEHLRNFQYEARRECVQQLALRVSVLGAGLARALRPQCEARLDTGTLADVARTVRAVKPLVCWLDRWPLGAHRPALADRKAALLKLALEAATCAQRDRFAEHPARAVAANALATAAVADYIVQDVSDPTILQPASLDTVTLKQGSKPLGFEVLPSFCGHHQLARIRFGSPAHASGAVYEGDEIVQVGGRCVIGWSGEAVVRACRASAARTGELALRVRRRGTRPSAIRAARVRGQALLDRCELAIPRPAPPEPAPPPAPRAPAASDSDESEPLSPPASPTHLHPDHTRMYPPKPRWSVQRRHTVSGGSPVGRQAAHTIEQFWRELREQHSARGDSASPEPPDTALYRRDKAVSCSTGLELSPRPRTCLGVSTPRRAAPAPAPPPCCAGAGAQCRGRLDKSHSTPAYDLDGGVDSPGSLVAQIIPESPTTPSDSPTVLVHSAEKADQILDFKKSSSQIGEAILQQRSRRPADEEGGGGGGGALLEAINLALLRQARGDRAGRLWHVEYSPATKSFSSEHIARYIESRQEDAPATAPAPAAAPSPPPRPQPLPEYPVLRPVPRAPEQTDHKEYSPLKPWRGAAGAHISPPLRHLTARDVRLSAPARALRPLNGAPTQPPAQAAGHAKHETTHAHTLEPAAAHAHRSASGAVRAMFPSAKSRSLKKKNSLLAKRRAVPARALEARGAVSACTAAGGAGAAGVGAGAAERGGDTAYVWQRVRARAAMQPRWARRYLLLAHNLLYAYRDHTCLRADCMIHLEGFTACAAGEVKSRAHAFKVYHTGTAFYFACASRDAMLAWIQLIHRATLLPARPADTLDLSKQFSETDYSETDTDSESTERRDRDLDRNREQKDKDKDKSKFGSLKKFGRNRSESHENVSAAAASLDRKYLRFFSRHRKDSHKTTKPKQGVPVPTEHYRSYRRVPPSPAPAPVAAPPAPEPERRLPTPINYIHASNPNLLDFERSEWVSAPPAAAAAAAAPHRAAADNFIGFVTLEEFMLKKQEEERRQVYTNRVLMGIERDRMEDRATAKAAKELQKRLDRIVPDVIYGELPDSVAPPAPLAPPDPLQARELPEAPAAADVARSPKMAAKPISITGKDGYEKLVYPEELADPPLVGSPPARPAPRRRTPPPPPAAPPATPAPLPGPDKWRDSLRRNDKVHSGGVAGVVTLKSAAQYTPLPLPLPAAHSPHLPAESWGAGAAAAGAPAATGTAAGGAGVSRLRLMFSGGRSVSRDSNKQESPSPPAPDGVPARRPAPRAPAPQYPHLQCPPTFQPETYSLARLAPSPPEKSEPQAKQERTDT